MTEGTAQREPPIRLEGVSKIYRAGGNVVTAVRDADFSLHSEGLAVVYGPSGSGKTTLLNLVGLIATPDTGRIYLKGQPVADVSERDLARLRRDHIGFVFQSFNLVPVLDTLENVMLPLDIRGEGTAAERRSRAFDALDQVKLAPFAGHRPGELSGGQQQRVAIARALVARPLYVLADEPTANLDSQTAIEIISLMQRLAREHGMTFLVATHDQRLIGHAIRRVGLEDGRIVSDETVTA